LKVQRTEERRFPISCEICFLSISFRSLLSRLRIKSATGSMVSSFEQC